MQPELEKSFQLSKTEIVNHLQAAIESFMAARAMSQETLAETLCGMSRPNFSKVSRGEQGDILKFIFETLPGVIREDFLDRVQRARQQPDPVIVAVEQMMQAAFTVLKLSGLPAKADHVAKVESIAGAIKRSA